MRLIAVNPVHLAHMKTKPKQVMHCTLQLLLRRSNKDLCIDRVFIVENGSHDVQLSLMLGDAGDYLAVTSAKVQDHVPISFFHISNRY